MKKETILNENETVSEMETPTPVEAVEAEKPYKFRPLSSDDIFLMFKIISKIGINEFTSCFGKEGVLNAIRQMSADEKKTDAGAMIAYASIALEAATVILANVDKCRSDIYKMLATTSNMTIEEITAEGNAVLFLEMVVDFLKKEEFGDFIKVVSKLFK
jgi:hypothetical protein